MQRLMICVILCGALVAGMVHAQDLTPDGGIVHSWETGISGWQTVYDPALAYPGETKVLMFKPNPGYLFIPLALLTQVVEEAGIYDLCVWLKIVAPMTPAWASGTWELSLQAWNMDAGIIARDEFGERIDLGRGIMQGTTGWMQFCQGMNVGQAGVLCQLRGYAHGGNEWPFYARAYIGHVSLIKR